MDDKFVDVPYREVCKKPLLYLLNKCRELVPVPMDYTVDVVRQIDSLMGDPDYKRVGFTMVWFSIKVSTVFLFVDHSTDSTGFGKPVLFETMVFGGLHDGHIERYCTWQEAENGHAAQVRRELAAPFWSPWEYLKWAIKEIGYPVGNCGGLPRDYDYEYEYD